MALTAYKPETLQADMEANMRDFLTNTKKGLSLDKAKGVITLSKVKYVIYLKKNDLPC